MGPDFDGGAAREHRAKTGTPTPDAAISVNGFGSNTFLWRRTAAGEEPRLKPEA